MTIPSEAHIIKVLLDISREMVETRALNPLLKYAVEQCMSLFDAEFGYLILINSDQELEYRVQLDATGTDINNPETKISRTIFNKAIDSGEAVLTISALDDPEFQNSESVAQMQLRSVLCVPLVSRGNSIGVLYLENRSVDYIFTRDYIEPLRYFAGQTAAVIENAILNEAMESQIIARTAQIQEANSQLEQAIAEREHIEKQLIKVALERERGHILNRFIQDSSHQFRTPLSVIKVSLKLLQEKYKIPQDDSHILQIKAQVDTIVELLNSMVLMVKLDTDGIRDELQTIDLNELINMLVGRWQQTITDKDQQLTLHLADDLPNVQGDGDLLSKALAHLIRNAHQYTPQAGNITLTTTYDDTHVCFGIKDTGEGIPEDKHEVIFQRFYRGDEAGTTRGFGLGLSIAQLVVELHDGLLELESEVGGGSMFRLTLPVKHQ